MEKSENMKLVPKRVPTKEYCAEYRIANSSDSLWKYEVQKKVRFLWLFTRWATKRRFDYWKGREAVLEAVMRDDGLPHYYVRVLRPINEGGDG